MANKGSTNNTGLDSRQELAELIKRKAEISVINLGFEIQDLPS